MPHSPDDKRKAIARLRRIQGQAAALERAIEGGADCAPVLQQIAALRGAVNGLMSEVLESHLRETFGPFAATQRDAHDELDASIEEAVRLVHTDLK
jgi:DNA-binding FrmR family transcriptional regulator